MSPPPEPQGANIAATAAAKKSSRACTECHNAKGKCVFSDDSRSQCDRCFRLNRECVPHLSRQGQRKKKADLMCADAVAAAAAPAAASSSPAGSAPQAPEASHANAKANANANARQGLLMDIIQGSQAGSSNPFGPCASFLAQLQSAASANAATARQQSLTRPAGPSSSGPARFQDSAFNRSMLPSIDQVMSSNVAANHEQDPHIALLLRQGTLANLNEARPPSATASNPVSSLLSLLQNNTAMGPLGPSSTAPFHPFANVNSAPSTSANHAGTHVLDALVQNARQQQLQQGLQESHLQDWQQQQQIQQIRIRHLIEHWLAHQARAGEVPQALGPRPGELHHNLGVGEQGAGHGVLQFLGLAPNVQQQQQLQDPEEEEGDCPSNCAVASKMDASSLEEASNSQEQSRLKKKKKAHFLPKADVVDVDVDGIFVTGDDESSAGCSSESDVHAGRHTQKRRTSDCESSSFHHVTSKRAKQQFANSIPARQPPKHHFQPPTSPSPEQQTSPIQEKCTSIIESADKFYNHILQITFKRNMDFSSLKNHFGVQCMIREWIALAFSRRSFGYLAKASQMALKFGINMNRILSGIDEEGLEELGEASLSAKKKEKSAKGSKKHAAETKVCIGGKMNYLLGILLEPRSVQAHPISERHMLTPHLDTTFLSHIAPASCSTFEDVDVRGRWIIVQETYRGDTKFYCSPMIERNVMCWTHMSQIYEDNLADIFSLIFGKEQFDRFQSYLARQVSLRYDEGTRTRPVHASMMKIRLFSKSWGETDYGDEQVVVTKEMVDEAVICDFPTRHVDMMLASVQTMDKHLCYLEFFDPRDELENHSNSRRTVTPDPSVPPTYAGTFPHLIF